MCFQIIQFFILKMCHNIEKSTIYDARCVANIWELENQSLCQTLNYFILLFRPLDPEI